MISYMQGTKFFKKPVISKSVIHKTVMDKDFLYFADIYFFSYRNLQGNSVAISYD